jgi:hypothetical protein
VEVTTVMPDGRWVHFDARPSEVAVVHVPRGQCPLVGRHPVSDCGFTDGGAWRSVAKLTVE